MKTLRPYMDGDDVKVRTAIINLRTARRLLREAGAARAAERVRLALRSADGALRHVERLESRSKARA